MKVFFPKQAGYLTLVTVVLIVIVGFISVALTYMVFGYSFANISLQQSTAALFLAESGLEDGLHELNTTIANRVSCANVNFTQNLGNGSYQVTGGAPSYAAIPTTITAALSATATSVTVGSTTGYQPSGRIMIDKELIDYTSTDATHFLSAKRGAGATVAAAHVIGTRVGQYQCQLTSIGGQPKRTYNAGEPGGRRNLSQAVQLQEAFAVGNTTSFMRWNRPVELIWNNASIGAPQNAYGVSMISYADGWAVGEGNIFGRWNGTSWDFVVTSLEDVTYRSVFCLSGNNCHAVGLRTSNTRPSIGDWNGTIWIGSPLTSSPRASDLYSVHCATATNCWAVGDVGQNANNTYFYRWNGVAWSTFQLSGFANSDFPYRGVSCPATNLCWAVGASANFAFWNGTTWSRVASGLPSTQYNSVHCTATNNCWAVGNVSGSVLIARWNGTSWTRVTATVSPAVNLNHVSCANADDCWAVGAAGSGQPTFVHWNGTSWTKVTTTGLPNVPANSVSIVGPGTPPFSNESENFG